MTTGGAAVAILFGREVAAEPQRCAQGLEGAGGHGRDADAHRLAVAGEVRAVRLPGRDPLEARDEPPVVRDLARREPGLGKRLPAAPDHHPPIGLGVGQRREHDGADDREDGRRRAHPESERRDRRGGEARRPPEAPERIPEVLEKGFHAGGDAPAGEKFREFRASGPVQRELPGLSLLRRAEHARGLGPHEPEPGLLVDRPGGVELGVRPSATFV